MSENKNLCEQIQLDYNTIRNEFSEKGEIYTIKNKRSWKSQRGRKKTRAFYFKTEFVKELLLGP